MEHRKHKFKHLNVFFCSTNVCIGSEAKKRQSILLRGWHPIARAKHANNCLSHNLEEALTK